MSIKEYYEYTLTSKLFEFNDIKKENLPSLSEFIERAIINKILPSDISINTDFNSIARCIIYIFQDHIEYLMTLSTIGLNRYKKFLKNDFKYIIAVLEHICPTNNMYSIGYLNVLKTEYKNALPILDC